MNKTDTQPRSIQFYVPPGLVNDVKTVWETLANELISDAEAGQRGAKASKLLLLISVAGVLDIDQTIKLLQKLRDIVPEPIDLEKLLEEQLTKDS